MNRAVLIAIPVLLVGGTEIQTLNLVNVLVGAGYNVAVCCYYEYDQGMVERFEEAGVRVILMKYERAKGLWHLAKGLLQLFRTTRPDIVHVQYVAPGFVPVIAARIAGAKRIFATVHQPGRTYGVKAKVLLRTSARLCNAFFCNSKAVEESWFGNSEIFDPQKVDKRRKHFTIYNGVDVEKIERIVKGTDTEALKKSLGIDGKRVVGVVGRLRWEKGQAVLLDAMAEVIKGVPESILLVVGDGPDKEKLRKKTEEMKLGNHVKWLGHKSLEEVYRLYSIMNVAAVPSIFEGFGLSVAEAMAAGVPVVASNVDGVAEIVRNDVSGFLVPQGNSGVLAERLITILNGQARAEDMGRVGQEIIEKQFSLERFRKDMLGAYTAFA